MIARRLYTLIWYLALPIILGRLIWRSIKAPGYRSHIAERLGFITPITSSKPCLWIHAVSLGESIAATPLIKALLQSGEFHLLITNTTPTGRARIAQEFGNQVSQAWAPYDIPACIERFLTSAKPCGLVIMETELWPNWLHVCRRKNIPSLLANGRLSAKSARGYQRFAALSCQMMNDISMLTVQTEAHAERFHSLGAKRNKIQVVGNIKFDIHLDSAIASKAQAARSILYSRPTFIAGSTHAGEDEIILAAFKQVISRIPNALLILVPRHPERFDAVAALIQAQGFTLARRSQDHLPKPHQQVLLGDTLGELTLLYGLAAAAFIGGSLIPRGGHNMLEAALWGIPIATGPHMDNFLQLHEDLSQCGALKTLQSANELAEFFQLAYTNPANAKQM
ncbi:MAG TPA: lipid IV(A) 3-deoxy-D-manno-octulosonic acid transferase, partial [Cellvibrionaceae bacterium]|nr:lipid IV(A) 3-deoxy-D-manno-octulosonic acid transferase [Cellvibrionaceae bacterium]